MKFDANKALGVLIVLMLSMVGWFLIQDQKAGQRRDEAMERIEQRQMAFAVALEIQMGGAPFDEEDGP